MSTKGNPRYRAQTKTDNQKEIRYKKLEILNFNKNCIKEIRNFKFPQYLTQIYRV